MNRPPTIAWLLLAHVILAAANWLPFSSSSLPFSFLASVLTGQFMLLGYVLVLGNLLANVRMVAAFCLIPILVLIIGGPKAILEFEYGRNFVGEYAPMVVAAGLAAVIARIRGFRWKAIPRGDENETEAHSNQGARFSLRSLMLLTTAIAIVFAFARLGNWFGMQVIDAIVYIYLYVVAATALFVVSRTLGHLRSVAILALASVIGATGYFYAIDYWFVKPMRVKFPNSPLAPAWGFSQMLEIVKHIAMAFAFIYLSDMAARAAGYEIRRDRNTQRSETAGLNDEAD